MTGEQIREWAKKLADDTLAGRYAVPMIESVARALIASVRSEAIEEAAKVCEALWDEEAADAVAGRQNPKYHDCIECAFAIRALVKERKG